MSKNLYGEEDEFITVAVIIFALIFLALCLWAGLRGEQRKSPNELRSEQMAEKYKKLRG